jgi:predicted ester cyclase
VHGLAAFKHTLQSFFDAFPDFEDKIEDLIAEGDLVTGRFTARGTHQGHFADVSPTGRRVELQGINMYRIRDGKIVEEWFQEDLLGLMQKLGAVPAPPFGG